MCVNGSFDSQFVHFISSTVNNFGVQWSAICTVILARREYYVCETDRKYVLILRFKCGKTPETFFIKRVRLVILAFYNLLGVHVL